MGGWVGGWDRWIEEEKAVRMRCCELWMGGWVGGWVNELFSYIKEGRGERGG